MTLFYKWFVVLLVAFVAACSQPEAEIELSLTAPQLQWVGEQIFRNECAGKVRCLVHWNEGEAFPSLGIGHFIWYPGGVEGRFVESFPELVAFMVAQEVALPPWLAGLAPLDAPWPDRASFLAQQDSAEVASLRQFLARTQGVQAEFIYARAQASLERVVAAAPTAERAAIRQRLVALSASPGGVYALLDYVNFKGEGLSATERYQGEGWGLLQVLQRMAGDEPALAQFRRAAAEVLTRRAHHASNPIERERWLPGWLNRLETYREPGRDDRTGSSPNASFARGLFMVAG